MKYKSDDVMKEIWKDIEGYEGFYQISNLGRVKSLGGWCGTVALAEKYNVTNRVIGLIVKNKAYKNVK